MPSLALVTGGAGFVGSHLVDALLAKKWEVVVIDNLSSGRKQNVDPRARLYRMDIRSPKAAKLVERLRPRAIFHLAAQVSVARSVRDPLLDAETNVHATLRLLDAASRSGVKRFVFAGTGGALSHEKTKLPTDEAHAAQPASPYAIAKVAGEHYGAFYRAAKKLPFVSYRPANIYGPRQNAHGEAGVVAVFSEKMLADVPLRVNGTGKQTRDYVYVADVVNALLTSLNHPDLSGPYHVGTGKETSVNELFRRMARLTGYTRKPFKGPVDIGAPMRSALDASRLRKDTGWEPNVDLADGLKQTVEWFREQIS